MNMAIELAEFLDDLKELIFFIGTEGLVAERFYTPKPFCVPDEKFAKNTDASFFTAIFNNKIKMLLDCGDAFVHSRSCDMDTILKKSDCLPEDPGVPKSAPRHCHTITAGLIETFFLSTGATGCHRSQ